MAIQQIGVTVGGNIKQYQALTTDSTSSYPTDCGAGSTLIIIDSTNKKIVNKYRFDGASWQNEQIIETVAAFSAKATITRSTVVTPYSSGQIILGNSATVLPYIDLSSETGLDLANRKIAITGAFLVSSNGSNSAFNGFIDFFNVNNPATTTSLADYVTFNPTISALGTNFVATLDGMNASRKYGTTSYLTMQTEVLRKCQLDSNGKLYFALVNNTAYTPSNGETLTLILKFYLLN